jgi:hypothetical protein
MSLLVQLKSIADPKIAFAVSLDLPSKPEDASETNSTWQVMSSGFLSFESGVCSAQKLKHAYVDALFLVHRMPESVKPNGRVVRGELVYGIPLWGFFGFDGGIREKGEGLVGPRFGLSLHSDIEWSIAPGQHYVRSLADQPRGDFPRPSERVRNTA